MKFLKSLGISLLALIAIFLILGLFAPNIIDTSQSMFMAASQETIFETTNDLKSWEEWASWNNRDSTIVISYGETSVGKGASYSWTSENSGAGTSSITGSWPSDSMHTHVDFGWQGGADARWIFSPKEGGTEVTWTFYSKFPYPFNTMLLFQDFKSAIDNDYREGLELLKAYVEAKEPASPDYSVQEIDFPATHYIADRATVAMSDLDAHFQSRMPALGMAVGQKGLEMTGMPAGLYYLMSDSEVDMALAIPVAAGETVEDYITIDLAAGPALKIDYYGDYGGLPAAHQAMDAYLVANSLVPKMPVVEIYKTDPGNEPDPSKWLTEVIYFVDQN